VDEQIEHLRLDRDREGAVAKLSRGSIKGVIGEKKLHLGLQILEISLKKQSSSSHGQINSQ
jgi:hypothetical protein